MQECVDPIPLCPSVPLLLHLLPSSTLHSALAPLSNSEGRYALEAFCVLGFAIFDMVYLSIVISYSFQCQLLIYYVQSIKDRVLAYDWPGLGLEQSPPTSSIDAILEKAMKVRLRS